MDALAAIWLGGMIIGLVIALVVGAVQGARGNATDGKGLGLKLALWPFTLVMLAIRYGRR